MENNNTQTIRTHRVGSVTAGLCMVGFGIMFLLHTLGNLVSYDFIFNLWPFMFIVLGLEILLSNFAEKRIVYDKVAVFLMVVMTFFAIGMAVADMCIQAAANYI